MRINLPSKVDLAHRTHSEFLESTPRCFLCISLEFLRPGRCYACYACADDIVHRNQVTPPSGWTSATWVDTSYIHIGLWVPWISAPWDVVIEINTSNVCLIQQRGLLPCNRIVYLKTSLTIVSTILGPHRRYYERLKFRATR